MKSISRGALVVSSFFVLAACNRGEKSLGEQMRAAADELVPAAHAAPAGTGGHCEQHQDDDVEDTTTRAAINVGNAPTVGPADAKVTVVVYSDFECPFCAKTSPVLEEIQAANASKVRLVFKQRPLNFHEHARLAAKAALAAQEQGKFWEMHDLLTKNARALERADLERYAAQLRLDARRFSAALDDKNLDARIDAEIAEGDALSIKGTPTTFVNGRRVIGARGRDALEAVVREELARP